VKNQKKILILLVQAAVVLAVLGAAGTVGFLEYSAQPGFCNNCHNMEPYYESWLKSSHNMVPCIKCHYAPGIKAEAMGKVQAANQVVKYVTRSFGEKPWAEIEDAACTREGCHLEQRLGIVSYRGVRFDHQQHLGELRRGKDLRCTSCHSQIVQGEHLTVTPNTCALCHFKDRPKGQPLGGCLGCHPSPPNLEFEGVPIDHDQIVRDLVSCSKCHSDVAVGDGVAEEQRCWNCHNIAERLDQFDDPTLLHEVHIALHNVECQQCHTEIQHKIVTLEETLELDCSNCHRGAHASQQALVSGSGGHGVEENPSRMFLARVTCESCHALPGELPGHEGVSLAGEATCLSCHGIEFAGILPGWEDEIQTRVDAVSRAVTQVRRALGAEPRVPADSLLKAAEENLELVRVGKGAHNIPFADELLRAAVRLAREAAQAGGADPRLASVNLGQPMEPGSCTACHYGVDGGGVVTWQGRQFPHRRHTVNAGFDCQACHTPFSEHGGLTLASTETCDNCHHRSDSPRACGFCHSEPAGDTIAFAGRTFLHDPHLAMGFGCDACHRAPSMAVQVDTCQGCHSLHHTPTANCLLCHDGAPQDTVATAIGRFPHQPHVDMGFTCATCHTEPEARGGTEVCAGCHSMHHQPSADCRLCHTGDPKANHRGDMAHVTACKVCHSEPDQAGLTQWSPNICLVCHQDREEHSGGMECTLCHEIPPLPGGGGGGGGEGTGGISPFLHLSRG
jgi:nitrate/TMAO reductase-like tetraheme cytochrome c subunit